MEIISCIQQNRAKKSKNPDNFEKSLRLAPMENKRLLSLLDKVSRIQNEKLATLYSELLQIVESEGQKMKNEEIEKSQFSQLALYLIQRLFSGATITDAIEQSR